MHGEGDKAILDRNWLGLVKAEIANLLKLGFLLGPFRAGLSPLSPRRLVYLNRRVLGNGHALDDGTVERLVGECGRVLRLAEE